MENDGKQWKNDEKPWKNDEKPWKNDEKPWKTMENHGKRWKTMENGSLSRLAFDPPACSPFHSESEGRLGSSPWGLAAKAPIIPSLESQRSSKIPKVLWLWHAMWRKCGTAELPGQTSPPEDPTWPDGEVSSHIIPNGPIGFPSFLTNLGVFSGSGPRLTKPSIFWCWKVEMKKKCTIF